MSVQQRLPSVARTSPILRVLEGRHVLLHEAPDPGRVRRLVRAFRSDGVLRNPPIVTPLSPDAHPETLEETESVLVLDGANRVTALRESGAPHVAVQVVRYGVPDVSVSTWTHYVLDGGEPLRRRIAAPLGCSLLAAAVPDAEHRLGRGDCLAVLIDADGAVVVGPGMDPIANVERLGVLVGLYENASEMHRVETRDLDRLRVEFGPGTAVAFPPLGKDDILRLATGGIRLPAGITRHLIHGRVLRLNVPLAWLHGPEPAAIKQSRLDTAVAERWRSRGVRYYSEATYLFDE